MPVCIFGFTNPPPKKSKQISKIILINIMTIQKESTTQVGKYQCQQATAGTTCKAKAVH